MNFVASCKFFLIMMLGFEIILVPGFASRLLAQTVENGFSDFAYSLYQQKQFDDAITEFYRCAFLSEEAQAKIKSYMGVGFCYRELNQPDQALAAFQKAKKFRPEPIQDQEIDLAIITIMISQGEYSLSQIHLISILLNAHNNFIRTEALQLLFISAILENDWRKIENYCKQFHIPDDSTMMSLLDQAKRQGKKSVAKAKWLSTFVPGLGQFYAGDYANAAKSFFINAVNLYITGHYFVEKKYQNALLYFLFVAERYYSGNRYGAGLAVVHAEERRNSRFARELLLHIKDNRLVLKPSQ